jgi:fructosamine-3-kinase
VDTTLARAVERVIADGTGAGARVVGSSAASGGCIHRAEAVELDDGRRFFVKSNAGVARGMFEREEEGLAALAEAGVLRVPRPIGSGETGDGTAFLVMEAIATGTRTADFSEVFGRRLADLHRLRPRHRGPGGEAFGFDRDNFLGATPQPNGWTADWCDFWRRHRLGHQLELARRNGLSDRTLDELSDRLLDRLEHWLSEPDEPAALLHGDLWGGNYMVDEDGAPVLIDPAVYCGRREADLAMTRLFGGFDSRFYAAYEEAWPLAPGSEERLRIYELYHLLNHLNLFGRGYRAGCVEILKQFA